MSIKNIQLTNSAIKLTKRSIIKKKEEKDQLVYNRLLSESIGLGFALVLPIAGGILIGSIIDKVFHTAPKLTLAFLFLGLMSSFIKLIEIVKSGNDSV